MTLGKWFNLSYCPNCNKTIFFDIGQGKCKCANCNTTLTKLALPTRRHYKPLRQHKGFKEDGKIKHTR